MRFPHRPRILTAAACLALALALLPGCAQPAADTAAPHRPHEVLTLRPVPEGKTMLTLQALDGVDIAGLEEGIEARFPNVDIVPVRYGWLTNDLAHGAGQDILLHNDLTEISACTDRLVELTTEPYLQNYYHASLWGCETGGKLYFLPGPTHIYGIVYNRDLFEQNGWEVPSSLDGFLQLCREIEQTGLRSLQPALYFRDATRQFLTGFTYRPAFYGVENQAWHDAYLAGEATLSGHIEPALGNLLQLAEAGALRPEDFATRPTTRSNMLYTEQSCAMIVETQNAVVYAENRAPEGQAPIRVGMMPFFSGNEPGSDFLLSVPQYYIALNKNLEAPGSEAKLALAREILAWLSTAEGQTAVRDPESTAMSSVRGVPWLNTAFFEAVEATIQEGRLVTVPALSRGTVLSVEENLRETLPQLLQGDLTCQQVAAAADLAAENGAALRDEDEVIGRAEEGFTSLQLAQLMADVFREEAGAQIGLCRANTRIRGVDIQLYEGELVYGFQSTRLDWRLSQCFISTDELGLVRLRMTGQALYDLLNASTETDPAFWVASGLKITFAPWAGDGQRLRSVTLADGSPLDPEAVYTVAAWHGSIDEALTLGPEQSYTESAAALFRRRVERTGSIRPEWDDDFILDWSVTAAEETEAS